MSPIAIQIPEIQGEQEIEIEVKINGVKKQFNYRVEIFHWQDCHMPLSERVECIKKILADYDQDWELYHIGMPTDEFVPITFRKKRVG